MEQSESIAALAAALVKAQGVIEGAVKDRNNPAFKSKYADLSSVWDAVRGPLSDNGLAVAQFPGEAGDGRMSLTTILTHASGEWMRSTMSTPLAKQDPQGVGSALTYMRRYALSAVLGVCPEDDDGNAASRSAPAQQDRQAPRISDEQRHELMALAQAGNADMRKFCTYFRIDAFPDLAAADFGRAKQLLQSKVGGGSNGNATH